LPLNPQYFPLRIAHCALGIAKPAAVNPRPSIPNAQIEVAAQVSRSFQGDDVERRARHSSGPGMQKKPGHLPGNPFSGPFRMLGA
jgi:hypothetical protein